MVKTIYLMRHAEREDRAIEKEGKDWVTIWLSFIIVIVIFMFIYIILEISTAPRPHDPHLSNIGTMNPESTPLRLILAL